MDPSPPRLRQLSTGELDPAMVMEIRTLITSAFGTREDHGFSDEDWAHSLGGVHFVLDDNDVVVAHASVVQRELHIDGRPLRTGYVEAVAVAPGRQGHGLGSIVMSAVDAHIREAFELGALSTGRPSFYERLGWQLWEGPTAVRSPLGTRPTPDDDGGILVLTTPTSPRLHLGATISCEWRPGDVW
jgi:aminoglycoside 2'-N-acetyltransferase I